MTLDNMDYSRDLLRSGIIEAKAGNKESARHYLDRALYMASSHEVMAEGWFWMSQVTDDPAEKRKALENCLSNDLQHARARRALAILDGKLNPNEIVDPDHLPPAPDGLQKADAQRFVCPKCGGRMSFSPDGQSLVCEYCSRNQTPAAKSGTANEKDFMVAMATLRGHGKPLAEQVFQCQGCGAQFILAPGQLSATCVYCGSPHVVSLEKSKDLLAPDGIIPMAFDQKHATKLLIEWVDENKIHPEKQVDLPRGLYLPLWSFDLGGWIDYSGEIVEQDLDNYAFKKSKPKVIHINDTYPILVHDFPIPASRKLSAPFTRSIPTFDLSAVQAYNAQFLANWPSELYEIPLADASLDARSQVYTRTQHEMPDKLSLYKLISTSSANMTIESFRLILLPVWMTEMWHEGRSHLVLINGQTGTITSDGPTTPAGGGLLEWLSDLVND